MLHRTKPHILFGKNKESMLLYYLFTLWREATLYNISNIFNISKTEFSLIRKKSGSKGKYSSAFINFYSFFGWKPNQDFRNFFYLKNISKENFDNYINFINLPPFNCNKEKFSYSEEDFVKYLKESKYWTQNKYSQEQKEKLALCDAIKNIWYDLFFK